MGIRLQSVGNVGRGHLKCVRHLGILQTLEQSTLHHSAIDRGS